ncbi:MAG: hypothetical protein NTY53_25115 [Kiritimatiellaeota bacterium]|nr:hypothetical protein [Kiritimatiellota bacterium]
MEAVLGVAAEAGEVLEELLLVGKGDELGGPAAALAGDLEAGGVQVENAPPAVDLDAEPDGVVGVRRIVNGGVARVAAGPLGDCGFSIADCGFEAEEDEDFLTLRREGRTEGAEGDFFMVAMFRVRDYGLWR